MFILPIVLPFPHSRTPRPVAAPPIRHLFRAHTTLKIAGNPRDSSAEFVSDFQSPAIAGFQKRTVSLPRVVVRADGMNDPLGTQVACCRPTGVTCGQSVGEPLDAVAQDRRASRTMNRTICTATPAHSGIRGIDYCVNLLLRDVATNRGDCQHAAQYAFGHRRQRGVWLRRRRTCPEPVRDLPGIPSRSSITPGRG